LNSPFVKILLDPGEAFHPFFTVFLQYIPSKPGKVDSLPKWNNPLDPKQFKTPITTLS
jgi:hypothetical protein